MKRMGFHVVWLLLWFASTLSAAEQAGRSAPEAVSVTYLANEAYVPQEDYVVVRSAFEINGPPHRWIALDVEFRLSQAVPLVMPDGKVYLKRWNNLFLPDTPRPARWTDCRLDVDFRELEKTRNLPKDKTFVLWAMGLIHDYAIDKHVGTGWPVRAGIVLTTDATGRIQQAFAPALTPIHFRYPSDKTTDALRMNIRTRRLKPLLKMRAYRLVRRDGTPITMLAGPKGQLWKPADFGGAFGTIDSAGKAEELVRLLHPGGVILHTPEQYHAVIDAARRLGYPPDALPKDDPEILGLQVTPVEGFGWRVEAVLLESRDDQLSDVIALDYVICTDGRVGAKYDVLLRAPDGTGKSPVSGNVYTAMMQAAVAGLSPDVISPRLVPTDDVAKLPLPADVSAEQFVSPTARLATPDFPVSESVSPSRPAVAPSTPDPTKPPPQTDVITTPGPTPIRKSQ